MNNDCISVKFPKIRQEFVYAAAALADPSFQDLAWKQGIYPRPRFEYSFTDACHIILDSVDLGDNVTDLVGTIFESDREVILARELATRLKATTEHLRDPWASFDIVSELPQWNSVMRAAQEFVKGIDPSKIGFP